MIVHARRQRQAATQSAPWVSRVTRGRLIPVPTSDARTVGSSAPFAGGLAIMSIVWVSPTAIRCVFTTTYGTTYLYQLYAGRIRIGSTFDGSERAVVGQLQPSLYPQEITLLAVDPAERLTDYGAELPLRPYNRVRLRFNTVGFASDTKYIDVTGSMEPGGAVDDSNLINRVLYDVDRTYEVITPALSGTGNWDFEIFGRDDKPAEGNAGTALAVSADVLAIPPDVVLNSDGTRLSVSVDSGVATITFTPQF